MTGEERKAKKNAKNKRTHALKKQKGELTRRNNQMEMKKAFMGEEGGQWVKKVYKNINEDTHYFVL